MGYSYGFECKKCGYKFVGNIGVGFLFPVVYQQTITEMKDGKHGELGKMFFEMYPDGAVDVEDSVFQCKKCGKFYSMQRLALYTPKEGYLHEVPKGRWSTAMAWKGVDYVSRIELMEHYDFAGEYDHKCECGSDVEYIPDFTKFQEQGIECPICKTNLECYWFEHWD